MSSPPAQPALARFALLFATIGLLVGVDRVIFHRLANRLWVYDSVLHYRQRPHGAGSWPSALGGKPIRFNSLGFHDDEFPVSKPEGERRILVVGDSVVMGHGVTAAEAFPNQLEQLLRRDGGSFQVINAGVQGYATDQYVERWQAGGWTTEDLYLDPSHLTPQAHAAVARRLRRFLAHAVGW